MARGVFSRGDKYAFLSGSAMIVIVIFLLAGSAPFTSAMLKSGSYVWDNRGIFFPTGSRLARTREHGGIKGILID